MRMTCAQNIECNADFFFPAPFSRRPSPSQSSLGGGWHAAGAGGGEGCLGEHLAEEGGFVSLHIGLVGAILGQQAGRECLHGSMTEQSGPAGDEGCREGCLQEGRCLSCFCLGKKFNKHGSFFTPSSSGFDSKHHESAAATLDELRVGSFFSLPCVLQRCPSKLPGASAWLPVSGQG